MLEFTPCSNLLVLIFRTTKLFDLSVTIDNIIECSNFLTSHYFYAAKIYILWLSKVIYYIILYYYYIILYYIILYYIILYYIILYYIILYYIILRQDQTSY